jgi:hypothetical protein
LGTIDPVTHRNDCVQVVELDLPADFAVALLLNSSNFSKSCLPGLAQNEFPFIGFLGIAHTVPPTQS